MAQKPGFALRWHILNGAERYVSFFWHSSVILLAAKFLITCPNMLHARARKGGKEDSGSALEDEIATVTNSR